VSVGTQFYISTLLVYAAVDILAAWGLNLQFGVAGLLSFAYIVFQAAGAYTAAVLSLGPDTSNGGFQHYIGGWSLPFPIPLLAAGVVGAAISVPIGLITLRRLRSDYQAIALLVVSIIATSVVMNQAGWLNGAAGLALVPQPLAGRLHTSPVSYQWFFAAFSFGVCGIVYFFLRRLTRSPLGRAMRAMRDNERAAASLGKNVVGLRLQAFAIGGAMAGLSGALLVEFIGTWAPSAWLYPETFVFLAVIIIGGTGNDLGIIVGVLLVPVAFAEATRFLPAFGRTGLIDALQWMAIGFLFLLFLWFRPQGVFPERRRRYDADGTPVSVLATVIGRLAPGRAHRLDAELNRSELT
jgi:ABC-type branched-subunit amino acid transport system permease subunit